MTASTEDLHARLLDEADIDAAVALNAEAGWNQCADDWRFMLLHGEGRGLVTPDGRLVATSMVLPFDRRFAWIAMILVTGEWQRRGLATRLMRDAIGLCEKNGWIAGLDATEAGRPVYLPLGFRDVYTVTRWMIDGPAVAPPQADVVSLDASAMAEIAEWDGSVFGADRSRLLWHLAERQPEMALALKRDDGIAGYILARNGRVATQVGPLVARDEASAEILLRAALVRCRGPVFLDANDRHAGMADCLRQIGFERQRGYVRMLLGRDEPLDRPQQIFLICGPEFA